VNDSPWEVDVRLPVAAPADCRARALDAAGDEIPLGGGRSAAWSLQLAPYSVAAARFESEDVRFAAPEVRVDPNVEKALADRLSTLGDRVRRLAKPPSLDLLENADFEKSAEDGTIAGWLASTGRDVRVRLDAKEAAAGKQSAHLHSDGPVASLVSPWMKPPATGRMSVLVALRTGDDGRQPPLRVAVESFSGGKNDYHYLPIGAEPAADRLGDKWRRFVFPFNDLPDIPGTRFRVRFDLMASGDVWMDDVRLFHIAFTSHERARLIRMLALAERHLQEKRLGDCAGELSGYWPRFLIRHVPPAEPPPADSPSSDRDAQDDSEGDDAARPSESPGAAGRLRRLLPF
jgi:hypothetical protein